MYPDLYRWLLIGLAVALASSADALSLLWARGGRLDSPAFLALLLLSPLVFITFGLISARLGLAVTSGVINSLLVLCTILIGLFVFGEWQRVSAWQYAGMVLSVAGLVLMLFFPKDVP
jgi:hypothetical protein